MSGIVALLPARAAASAFLGKISPKIWLALGCAVALVLGVLWHRHEVKATIATAKAEQRADDQKVLNAQAAKIRAQDAQLAAMSSQLRKANDEEHSRIDADAGAVLVRGPGKAVCPGVSSPPAAPGRPIQAAPEAGPAVAPVPDSGGQQLIALPFAPTVELTKEHDQCLADRRSIDAWYDALVKAWPKHP